MVHRATHRYLVVAGLAAIWVAGSALGQGASQREALNAYTSGDLPRAERLLRQIVTREPGNRAARFFLGNALYYQKKYQPAIEVYEPLAAEELKDPQLAALLSSSEAPLTLIDNLAKSYGISGQHEQCLAILQTGIAAAPYYAPFYFSRACTYAEMGGREEEALVSAELALRMAMRTLDLERMLVLVRKDNSLKKLIRQSDLFRLLKYYKFPRSALSQESADEVSLTLNHERLKVSLRLPGFVNWVTRHVNNPKQVLSAKAGKGNMRVTLWSTWVGREATAQQCREYFFGMLKSAPAYQPLHKEGSERFEDHPTYALVIHDAIAPRGPRDWLSRSYNAYYVVGEYCFDLHLSAERPTQATEAKMRAIIESFTTEAMPPFPALFLKEEPQAKPPADAAP